MAQSVQRQAAGWMKGVRFTAGQDFSLLHNIQTGSGAHRVDTAGSSSGVNCPGH
jgi:hypothetical protein